MYFKIKCKNKKNNKNDIEDQNAYWLEWIEFFFKFAIKPFYKLFHSTLFKQYGQDLQV
jgi:hypothetical protein